jgi:hypothetical protein
MWQEHSHPHGAYPLHRLTYRKHAEKFSVGNTKSSWTINTVTGELCVTDVHRSVCPHLDA